MHMLSSVSPLYTQEKNMLVYVEHSVLEEPQLLGDAKFASINHRLTSFTEGKHRPYNTL